MSRFRTAPWRAAVVLVLGAATLATGIRPVAEAAEGTRGRRPPKKELFSGKIVSLRKALKARGISVGPEMEQQFVLDSSDGRIIPIAADWRGRAFYQDKRLRDRRVELVGFRRPGVPYLQILIVYTFDKENQRLETDYWCDTCAIPLYELKMCECCQDPIRMRFRATELPAYLSAKSPSNDKSTSNAPQTDK